LVQVEEAGLADDLEVSNCGDGELDEGGNTIPMDNEEMKIIWNINSGHSLGY